MEWLGFMVSFGFYMDLHTIIDDEGEDDDIEAIEEEIAEDVAEEEFDEGFWEKTFWNLTYALPTTAFRSQYVSVYFKFRKPTLLYKNYITDCY